MYTIRGLGAGAFTGESFATGNRLAQSQVASNPIARAALADTSTPFMDTSGQIAQARAEAEAAAAARRAEIEAAEGGECRALAEQFIAAATALGRQPPPIEALMNECLMTGPAEFRARLQAAGVSTDGGAAGMSTGTKVAIGVGVGLAALAAFSFFK